MCTVKTHESLIVIHHEMGHIQYFMNYENQSVHFRDGANPGMYHGSYSRKCLEIKKWFLGIKLTVL